MTMKKKRIMMTMKMMMDFLSLMAIYQMMKELMENLMERRRKKESI